MATDLGGHKPITPPMNQGKQYDEFNSREELDIENDDGNIDYLSIADKQPTNEALWEHGAEINGNHVTMSVKEMIDFNIDDLKNQVDLTGKNIKGLLREML